VNDTLRADEAFVTTAIARDLNVAWKAGNNPPDAYLLLPEHHIALEVTRLEEVDIDEKHGGNRPRRSDDTTAAILANELNKTLKPILPDGTYVMLHLNDAITKSRKTRAALKQLIIQYVRDYPHGSPKHNIVIHDNKIGVQIKRVSELMSHTVIHMHSHGKIISNTILKNAWIILEERIRSKAQKCRGIGGEIWLGLLNEYWLADAEIYRKALRMFHVEHPFSKIWLVSLDSIVEIIYDLT
jgi:hypothetical protein